MKDPFPVPPPEALVKLAQPFAEALRLPTLGLHAHEVLFAFVLYSTLCGVISPILSARIWPDTYSKLNRRTRINWDVHITSFFQSVLISALALYTIFYDEERKENRERSKWDGRVWEYTGLGGMLQSFGLGYFLWDLVMCTWYVRIFGWGMLAHAISAVSVFALGYRPFVHFYAPVFLLYELSSPFLNVHWFCDKLNLTGSSLQAINGAFLTGTFFGCRLIWGNISSFWVFYDIIHAIMGGSMNVTPNDFGAPRDYSVAELMDIYNDSQMQRLAFRGAQRIPLWLALTYLASNLTLNSLNFFWFGKMIATIRSRFDPPWGTKGISTKEIHWEPQPKPRKAKGSVKAARERAEAALQDEVETSAATGVQRVELVNGSKSIESSEQKTARTRRKA